MLRAFLNLCYNSIELQLVVAPFVAALAHDRRRLRVFLYGIVYSSIAGSLIYYFFPSSGPAGIFQSPDFLPVQRLTQIKFEQVHHFQPVTTLLGGLIAFPSFHVCWSVLATYAALPRKKCYGPWEPSMSSRSPRRSFSVGTTSSMCPPVYFSPLRVCGPVRRLTAG